MTKDYYHGHTYEEVQTIITAITKDVSKQLANVAQQQPNNAKKVNNGLSRFIFKLQNY